MLLLLQKFFLVAKCSAGNVDVGMYGVYYAIMTSKELIALLKQDGWILRVSKGYHHVYVHPSKAGHLIIPNPRKTLAQGLFKRS
jgi:predicted RNA binding protein YcfA (HicA-like mRNA interferase family)